MSSDAVSREKAAFSSLHLPRHISTLRRPVSVVPVANVNNMVEAPPIEMQLYGTSTAKNFLLPESSHPWAPAVGRWPVKQSLKSKPYC
jgi:hypothetical protein